MGIVLWPLPIGSMSFASTRISCPLLVSGSEHEAKDPRAQKQ